MRQQDDVVACNVARHMRRVGEELLREERQVRVPHFLRSCPNALSAAAVQLPALKPASLLPRALRLGARFCGTAARRIGARPRECSRSAPGWRRAAPGSWPMEQQRNAAPGKLV